MVSVTEVIGIKSEGVGSEKAVIPLLRVQSNGVWTYTAPASVDNTNGPVMDSFSYTITDKDGDNSTASQPIFVTNGPGPAPINEGFGVGADQYLVYEKGLTTGSAPDAALTLVTGNLLANDQLGTGPAIITEVGFNGQLDRHCRLRGICILLLGAGVQQKYSVCS